MISASVASRARKRTASRTVAAFGRNGRRIFWIGFATLGWTYMTLMYAPVIDAKVSRFLFGPRLSRAIYDAVHAEPAAGGFQSVPVGPLSSGLAAGGGVAMGGPAAPDPADLGRIAVAIEALDLERADAAEKAVRPGVHLEPGLRRQRVGDVRRAATLGLLAGDAVGLHRRALDVLGRARARDDHRLRVLVRGPRARRAGLLRVRGPRSEHDGACAAAASKDSRRGARLPLHDRSRSTWELRTSA